MNNLKQRIAAYFDSKLIPEWRKAWAFLTVKADAIMGSFVLTWIAVPDEQKAAFAAVLRIDPAWLVIIGIVVRLYYRFKPQPALHAPAPTADRVDPRGDAS